MKVVILGAGPAGLSAAYFAQQGGHEVTIIEKTALIGGKGASQKDGQYILDLGPHAYHPGAAEIDQLFQEHCADEYLLTPVVQKLVLNNRVMQYPFRFTQGLFSFNPFFSSRLLSGYLFARLQNLLRELPEDSFESYGIKNFGRPLYDLCFGNYTERVWGIAPDQLCAEFARRKLPRFSISGMLREWITKDTTASHAHLFGTLFGYHKRGAGAVYESIARGIQQRQGQIILEADIESITLDTEGKVADVVLHNEAASPIPCDYIVSTIPLSNLVDLLPVQELKEAAAGLSFRDLLLIYVFLKRPKFSDAHWHYLVDSRFKCNRMSEQKNLSSVCCPEDNTVLTLEISTGLTKDYSSFTSEQLLELISGDLDYFGISPAEVERISSYKLSQAYPIFTKGYESSLESFFEEVGKLPNLISTGRQGLFFDVDMHDAMYLGKLASDSLAEKCPRSFYDSYKASLREAKSN